jgi:3-methylcrotonyl-CoA carboxylase beta subunit
MARILLHPVGRELDELLSAADQEKNVARVAALDQALAEKVAVVQEGWGQEYALRVHEKGKWTTQERLERLLDEGSPFFGLGTLVNWGRAFQGSKRQAPGAGVLTGLGRVAGRWVVVIANDNTVASGAWWPLTPEKIERAQAVATRLRLPVLYLVDCSGLFLPEQSRSFSGPTGAGHIFTMNARLAASGVPQIAAVFGDCIAGGGYMPIISDRVVMTEGAYMVIAGAALIKGAKAQHLTSLGIGGPEVHVHLSRCADERVPDDATAIRVLREEVAKLPGSAVPFYQHGASPEPPRFDPAELSALFPSDVRQTYDIEEVIARLVDSSLFHEVLPHVGREMVTGLARIRGLWVGLIANRQGIVDEPGIGRRAGGVLYREGIAKISAFARCCDDDGIPVIWLQDISGFDIGVEAELHGLLGYGSNLIYTNSTVRTPFFTVLLRKASGAGYYAMSGMPYEPVVQLATPLTRLAVMEGRTLAIAAYNSKLDDEFRIATEDPVERGKIEEGMAQTAARIEADMDPVRAASVMDTDEVVPLSQLRPWLECLVEAAWQSIGYRRTKNPRIWSVHDLETLGGVGRALREPKTASLREDAVTAPTVGTWSPSVGEGSPLVAGSVLGHLDLAGARVPVHAPDGVRGVATSVLPAGSWVEHGARLLAMGLPATGQGIAAAGSLPTAQDEGGIAIRSDTDGTIYLRPEPGAPPFVTVGAAVARSTTLALIEVMKTYTAVRSPVEGKLIQVLVTDGAAVRAGDILFRITI